MHSPRFDPIRTLACVCQITRDPTSLSSIALNFDLADRSPRCLSCYSVYRLRKERLKRFRVFGIVKRTNFFFFKFTLPISYTFYIIIREYYIGPIFFELCLHYRLYRGIKVQLFSVFILFNVTMDERHQMFVLLSK